MSAAAPPRIDLLPTGSEARDRPAEHAQSSVPETEVTANSVGILSCLAAPPRDVDRMLRRHDATLPRYLDVHRLRQIEASHRRWPLLSKPAAAGSARGRR